MLKGSSSVAYFFSGLLCFLVVALIGITIRWHFLYPIDNFNYLNWLHAHSHVAFLGWIFLGLTGLINLNFENDPLFPHQKFKRLLWPLILTNVGMLIFFPIQGYGPVSILFSSIHMILALFVMMIYRNYFRRRSSLGISLIKWGFFWMIISGIGPLALGPVILTGHRETIWYDFSIYFYLHFQYNGFFALVILGLILHHLLKIRDLYLNRFRTAILLGLNIAVVLTFLLSTLSIDPPLIVFLLGGLGAVIQIVIIIFILLSILQQFDIFLSPSNIFTNVLLISSLMALELKLYLQFFSGIPSITDWVFHNRNIIIAYLHLVLLGFISTFIIGWWYKLNSKKESRLFKFGVIYYLTGFSGMEIILVLVAFRLFRNFELAWQLLLIVSVAIFLGILIIIIDLVRNLKTTNTTQNSK